METLTPPAGTSAGVSHETADAPRSRASRRRTRPAPASVDAPANRTTEIKPRSGWQAIDLAELWRARDLLWIFTVRDVKVRYKQTFLGFAWALIVPVAQVLVFTVFFGSALGIGDRINRAAGRTLPYPLFALTGQIVWNFFKMTVDGASNSLLTNAAILRKIYVPRLVLPLSALGKPAVDTAMVFLLMAALVAWYAAESGSGVEPSWHVLLSPLLLAGSAIPALGLGLIVAAITVSYRDLQHVLPIFTQLLFFVTPVIYSVEILPARLAWLMYFNPAAGFVQAHRAVVIGLPVDWGTLTSSLALSTVLLVFGLFCFARAERQVADVA
ncbi:MAG TPA: ABC transporter permease [Vicinamibacterales bacterium]|nr:ABC transporter permease [Vicinamibacterales bacterium]